jgi:hypothetical protein
MRNSNVMYILIDILNLRHIIRSSQSNKETEKFRS